MSVVKDVAGQSIKEAVVHGAKRIALTNETGKGLVARDLAKEMADEAIEPKCYYCQLLSLEQGHSSIDPICDLEYPSLCFCRDLVTENVNIFLSVCKHVRRRGVNCVFCCRASLRFDVCDVFISALY